MIRPMVLQSRKLWEQSGQSSTSAHLYGHTRHVYTDYEALKALLNTPHTSSKLARWGQAIQELGLRIHYQPWQSNKVADAFSQKELVTSEEVHLEHQSYQRTGMGPLTS